MYIRKTHLIVISIILIIVTAVISVTAVNPFGIKNLDKFIKFSITSKLLQHQYYQDIALDEAAEMSILGFTAATNDPYTSYIWGDDMISYLEQLEGNYCGVGLYIENDTEENLISVASAIEGGPAFEAGIKSGDKILMIDGKNYAGTELSEAASYMKGEENTEVTLTIRRAETNDVNDITLIRRNIEIDTLSSKMLEKNIGYIKMTQFTEGVSEKLLTELHNLKEDGMQGLILDLRDNPGGLLNEAVSCASIFVPTDKIITYTLNKNERKEEFLSIETDKISIPMVILLNGGSASASEVLSGALRDYELATIIGEKSFGKGVVQSVIPIGFDAMLTVTNSTYYSPSGKCIHNSGIQPDIEIKLLENTDNQLDAAVEFLLK